MTDYDTASTSVYQKIFLKKAENDHMAPEEIKMITKEPA